MVYSIKEMMFGFDEKFIYFQCSECECLQIAEVPLNISKFYPSSYYSFSMIPSNQKFGPIMLWLKKQKDIYTVQNKGLLGQILFKLRPNENLRSLSHLELTKESSILDVGCGSGSLLYALRDIGFMNTFGIDPNIKNNINYPNGLKIQKKSIDNIAGKWDLIMFHHSFEHIHNQLETLMAASELLNEGAYCLIRVPTVSSYAWDYYREKWVQIDAPRHFFLHSLKSIKLLAEKANFTLEKIVYDSTSLQFTGSERYLKEIPLFPEYQNKKNFNNNLFSKKELKYFDKKTNRLNLEQRGDQASFYLKKK